MRISDYAGSLLNGQVDATSLLKLTSLEECGCGDNLPFHLTGRKKERFVVFCKEELDSCVELILQELKLHEDDGSLVEAIMKREVSECGGYQMNSNCILTFLIFFHRFSVASKATSQLAKRRKSQLHR